MKVIENISALRQESPNLAPAVYVMGTSGIGDGGAGIYVFEAQNPGPDNGNTVVASEVNGSGFWVLQVSNASGGSAPAAGPYVVAQADQDVPSSRVLTAGNNISVTDNGPGSTIVIASTGGGVSTASLPLIITASNIALGTAVIPTTNDVNASVIWSPSLTTRKGLILQGLPSQTANVFEVQTSTGVNVFCIDVPTGVVTGANNNLSGVGAGVSLTSGSSNCLYGVTSGNTLSTGGSNSLFGSGSAVASSSTQNAASLGAATTVHDFSIVLGAASASTAANQFVAGNANGVNDVYFGKGVVSSTATAYTINGTGGSGSDNAGAALQLAGGKGTGLAEPGLVVVKYPLKTTTGSTLQSLSTQSYPVSTTMFVANTGVVTVDANVVNTTETTLIGTLVAGSRSLEGGMLRPGRIIRWRMAGILSTSAAPVTFNIQLKKGSEVICSTTALTPSASITNGTFVWEGEANCNVIGSTGSFFATSLVSIRQPTTSALFSLSSGGSGTVNTTTTSNLDFTITFGGNTAGNSITVAVANVHILN